jgi:hypothetical protein
MSDALYNSDLREWPSSYKVISHKEWPLHGAKKKAVLSLLKATRVRDNATDHAIKMSLENLRNECEILIITSRLSTVEACDKCHNG